jgi:site-specific DNA-methyltransferase (adenine-specific)
MARKPLRGTVAANVLAYGTGALNIDGTRIGTGGDKGEWPITDRESGMFNPGPPALTEQTNGRWPANVVLTDPIFDGGVDGVVGGGPTNVAWTRPSSGTYEPSAYGLTPPEGEAGPFYGDTGTYSRFFLIPKAARGDREPLVGGLPDRPAGSLNLRTDAHSERTGNLTKARANIHPTVKPVELMRHLVRLVTPPGGVVLDCFLGSGSTAIAANMEGFRCIGIERELEYLEIAKARLAHQRIGLGLDVPAPTSKRTTPTDAKMPKPRFRESGTPKGWNGGWDHD